MMLDLYVWVKASILKHFHDTLSGIAIYAEGQERLTNKEAEYVEVRLTGPSLNPEPSNTWSGTIDINLLLSSTMDRAKLYKQEVLIGKVVEAFVDIAIYKYGTPESDGSFVTCISLDKGRHEVIRVSQFGLVDSKYQIEQATVSATYRLDLEGTQ